MRGKRRLGDFDVNETLQRLFDARREASGAFPPLRLLIFSIARSREAIDKRSLRLAEVDSELVFDSKK